MKEHFSKYSYWYFWGIIPFIIFLRIDSKVDALDFNIHDTYYVIGSYDLIFFFSFYFLFIGLGYFLMKKRGNRLSKWLTTIHTLISTLFFVVIFISLKNLNKFQSALLNEDNFFNYFISFVYIIPFLLVQLLFPINILISFFKKK